MLAVNYSTIRNRLKDYCDKVTDEQETVIVTRKDEKNVVIISLDEYNMLMNIAKNTGNLNSVKHQEYIKRELDKATEMANDPNTVWLSEEEMWAGFDDSDEKIPNINLLTAMNETEQILEDYETGTRKCKTYSNAHDLIQDILNEEDEVDV